MQEYNLYKRIYVNKKRRNIYVKSSSKSKKPVQYIRHKNKMVPLKSYMKKMKGGGPNYDNLRNNNGHSLFMGQKPRSSSSPSFISSPPPRQSSGTSFMTSDSVEKAAMAAMTPGSWNNLHQTMDEINRKKRETLNQITTQRERKKKEEARRLQQEKKINTVKEHAENAIKAHLEKRNMLPSMFATTTRQSSYTN